MSPWHRIHGRSFFHQYFDGLIPSIPEQWLASIVLMRSHLLTFGDSLMSHFSLAVFEIFLFVFFNTFDYDASRCDFILLGVKFLGCVFHKTWKVSVIISSYFFLSPFLGVSGLCSFFSFCSSDRMVSVGLSSC